MKTILITGTSSGIGATVANYLSTKGYKVFGTSRRSNKTSDNFITLPLDVTDDQSVAQCFDIINKEYGGIDILINNAGIVLAGSIEDTSIAEAQNQLDVNYFGIVRMVKRAIPIMKERKGGTIINISSISGIMGNPFQGHYSASKFALEGLTESLRLELKPFNIRITNINPGDFKTNITNNRWFSKISTADYQPQYGEVLTKYEEGERKGADPMKIAKLIEKLINKNRQLKARHIVGNYDQVLFMSFRRILGHQLFERLLAKALGL